MSIINNIKMEIIDDFFACGKYFNFEIIIMRKNGYVNSSYIILQNNKKENVNIKTEFFKWYNDQRVIKYRNYISKNLNLDIKDLKICYFREEDEDKNEIEEEREQEIKEEIKERKEQERKEKVNRNKFDGRYIHPYLLVNFLNYICDEFAYNTQKINFSLEENNEDKSEENEENEEKINEKEYNERNTVKEIFHFINEVEKIKKCIEIKQKITIDDLLDEIKFFKEKNKEFLLKLTSSITTSVMLLRNSLEKYNDNSQKLIYDIVVCRTRNCENVLKEYKNEHENCVNLMQIDYIPYDIIKIGNILEEIGNIMQINNCKSYFTYLIFDYNFNSNGKFSEEYLIEILRNILKYENIRKYKNCKDFEYLGKPKTWI